MTSDPSFTSEGHASGWFARVMFMTAEAIGIKITEARVRVYAHDLAEFERGSVERAFQRCRREGKGFFPQIAELIREIQPSPDDAALIAWNALELAAQAVGTYQSIEFDDAAAGEAVRTMFGSWPAVCACEKGPEWLVKRQAFVAAYRAARRRLPAHSAPVRLAGDLEASGNYRAQPGLWYGRLTLSGEVVSQRERPALPAAGDVNRLTDGEEPFDESLGDA